MKRLSKAFTPVISGELQILIANYVMQVKLHQKPHRQLLPLTSSNGSQHALAQLIQ